VTRAVLVTGAEGALGRALVAALSAEGPVIAWSRVSDRAGLAAARARILARLPGAGRHVRVAGGDLARDDAFAGVAPAAVGAIVHAAAVTRFDVPRPLAAAVNVHGTRRLLALARRCVALDRVVHCSSVYAAGLATGPVAEAPLPRPPGFTNHYEWSKWASERVIEATADDLPVHRLRVGVVVAERPGGPVGRHTAVHEALRLYHRGWLSLVPGLPETRLWLATTDLVVQAVRRALRGVLPGPITHVTYGGDGAPRLADAIAAAFAAFEEDPAYARRALPRPLFCSHRAFESVCQGVDGFGGARLRRAAACVAPFARQLYAGKRVVVGAGAPGSPLDGPRLLADVCRRLVATDWAEEDGAPDRATGGGHAHATSRDRAAG
jgi:nucleoside-diphosphate-sugar epimerase